MSYILPLYFINYFAEPLEACSSSPCQNGASCVDINVDTFICVCRDEYFGINCGESEFLQISEKYQKYFLA